MTLDDPRRSENDTQRLEAFSDGVFAIAITLLIIEIAVPHVRASESLAEPLRDLWPSYFGYAVSFVTIGIMWANHHSMFRDITRVDHWLLVLNLLLLMCIAFVPFPTALIAEYMRDSKHQVEATLAYGGTFTVIAIVFNALWLYVSSGGRLLDSNLSEHRIRLRTLRYAPGPLIYGLTLPLAFVSPWLSLSIYGALALLYLLPYSD